MNNNKFLYATLGIVLVAVMGLFLIYIVKQPKSNTPTPSAPEAQEKLPERGTPYLVPFDYSVTNVSEDQIILNGEKGELILPQDPEKVAVFFDKGGDRTPAQLSDVQVGMKANLNINPGVSAELYLIQE
jgi:hypothetical protein